MKKKIIACVIALILLAGATAGVIIAKNRSAADTAKSYDNLEQANEAADFNLVGSDRLCGYPQTDYEASSSEVKINYAGGSYVTKTLGETGESGSYEETSEQDVDGVTVTLGGEDGKVFFASWTDNGFSYAISLASGVDTDEMIEYIKATY